VTGPRNLEDRARAVIDRNRSGDHTCPSVRLYPHQWLWDSCFTAIGIARFDPQRAAGELRALLRGQWDDGMLPHMLFTPGTRDIGSRRLWRSRRRAGAPRDVDTSCITQPPLVAIAVERVAAALPEPERAAFVSEVLPALVAYHGWLFRERRLDGAGLITLLHPWECGLDSTPPWMHALRRWKLPWWLRAAERLNLARLLRSLRYDTRYLPAAERTADDDGLRMLALAVHLSRYDFVLSRVPRDDAVLIDDVAFNAMFAVANEALTRLGDTTFTAEIAAHRAALEELWDGDAGEYRSRDAVSHAPLTEPSVAGALMLWCGAEHADEIVARLQEARSWPAHPVPSVPTDSPDFHPTRYWKGPTWVNVNWILVEGLHRHGAHALSAELRTRTLAMVDTAGFAEYFSPLTGEGQGAPEFTWTAALTVELLHGG
jgi:hypothetical protein